MLNRRNKNSINSLPDSGVRLSRPFIPTSPVAPNAQPTVETAEKDSSSRWRPDSKLNTEERRQQLGRVLKRCTERLGQLAPREHIFQTGEYCGVIRGKFYGARGVVRDVDFIHNRILVDLKSYKEPVWMDPGELEPD